jgi:trigger factor
MKTAITKTTATDTTFTVTLDQAHLGPIKTATINKLRPKVKVAGFRPGKAPDHIVERELGDATVQSEVIDAAIGDSYANAVVEHGLAVIAPPSVSVTKFVPFTELEYTATVDIMPEVKLVDYKKIKKKRPEVKVEQAEVDQAIEDLRKRLATKHEVERPAKMGDEVTLDFDGTQKGQPVEGASAKNHVLQLGSKTFIPGFEDQLVGLEAEGTKTFKITFPKDYQATDLAGQEVEFSVTVHKITEVQLPEVNEKFVTTISPLKTVEDLRKDISERIKAEKLAQADVEFEKTVLDEIVEKSQWDASERLISEQVVRLKTEMEDRLASSGLDLDKYLSMSQKTLEDIDKELQPVAKNRVGLALVLNKIAREEGIVVEPAEIESELAKLKSSYQDPQMQAELSSPEIRAEINNHVLATKTVAKILEYVTS